MSSLDLTSGAGILADAAYEHLRQVYQGIRISRGASIDSKVNWAPTLSLKLNAHKVLLVEVSETPYPQIFRMRRQDIMNLEVPISVYAVCPEDAYLQQQALAKELIADGYGLFTVDLNGQVQKRSSATPLIQQIVEPEFRALVKSLPTPGRTRLAEAFEHYKDDPPLGVSDITEVAEGIVLRAGRDAVKKGWLVKASVRPGAPAETLKAMQAAAQFNNAAGAVGAVQGYISVYRNAAHHAPKNSKQASIKYRACRHAFLEGLHKIPEFRAAMRQLGLSGAFV